MRIIGLISALSYALLASLVHAASYDDVRERLLSDAKMGKPIVIHVTVALCDNDSQGIVPVGNGLCVGESPRTNLYWGAMYGLKTFFSKHPDWKRVALVNHEIDIDGVVERIVFERQALIGKAKVVSSVFIVADAWRGVMIKRSLRHFLEMSSGSHKETVAVRRDGAIVKLPAGGQSHVTGYIGHNGLMDFSVPALKLSNNSGSPKGAIILACYSNHYFGPLLSKTDTLSLLTTTGLMAPEAYTLEAALTSWVTETTLEAIHKAASEEYAKFQKANVDWSKRLFVSGGIGR